MDPVKEQEVLVDAFVRLVRPHEHLGENGSISFSIQPAERVRNWQYPAKELLACIEMSERCGSVPIGPGMLAELREVVAGWIRDLQNFQETMSVLSEVEMQPGLYVALNELKEVLAVETSQHLLEKKLQGSELGSNKLQAFFLPACFEEVSELWKWLHVSGVKVEMLAGSEAIDLNRTDEDEDLKVSVEEALAEDWRRPISVEEAEAAANCLRMEIASQVPLSRMNDALSGVASVWCEQSKGWFGPLPDTSRIESFVLSGHPCTLTVNSNSDVPRIVARKLRAWADSIVEGANRLSELPYEPLDLVRASVPPLAWEIEVLNGDERNLVEIGFDFTVANRELKRLKDRNFEAVLRATALEFSPLAAASWQEALLVRRLPRQIHLSDLRYQFGAFASSGTSAVYRSPFREAVEVFIEKSGPDCGLELREIPGLVKPCQ